MEHLYQPEELIFGGDYETFKEYYNSPHSSPKLHNAKFPELFSEGIPFLAQNESTLSLSTPGAVLGSLVDGYFHLSWYIVYWASQQPHCIWPLVNVAYCLLILLTYSIQRKVFGNLRSSEQENVKEQFWNLIFYKVVFVFGVVNVQDVEDAVGWCFFVSMIGFLQLARQLCQERHNYLILMNDWSRRGQCRRHRILGLLCFIFASSIILFLAVGGWYFGSKSSKSEGDQGSVNIYYGHFYHAPPKPLTPEPSTHQQGEHGVRPPAEFNLGLHSAIFMLCELGLLVIQTLHVLIMCIFEQVRAKWYKGRQISDEAYAHISHAINFKFDLISLLFDLVHHVHMLVCCNLFLSMTSLVVSLQMRNRVRQIHKLLKKRQSYLWLNDHINQYPDAVFEDETAEEERCAICWDALSSQRAKSLPCRHIFHKPCLRQWLLVSMNCPTCRLSLLSEKEKQFRSNMERQSRRLYAPRPIGFWGFLQTGQALLDLFGGWDPQYDEIYEEEPSPNQRAVPPRAEASAQSWAEQALE